MALVFTGTPNDKHIIRGYADAYFGTYVASGADAALNFLGGLGAKVDFHFTAKTQTVSIEQALNPVAHLRTEEECKITTSFRELTLQRYQWLLGMTDLPLVSGTDGAVSGT